MKNIALIDEKFYSIGDVVMITGLSDRTVRSYVASGILKGEKINGQWQFSSEQIGNFMNDPNVRPSIIAKKNALVYDFLIENKRKNSEICIIIDIPDGDRKRISDFFCSKITCEGYKNIRFSFDSHKNDTPRVILKGDSCEVLRLTNAFYEQ